MAEANIANIAVASAAPQGGPVGNAPAGSVVYDARSPVVTVFAQLNLAPGARLQEGQRIYRVVCAGAGPGPNAVRNAGLFTYNGVTPAGHSFMS